MSKLQNLIDELCPDGVEFKKLGEVCKIERGTRVVRKDLFTTGEIPVYQNSLIPLGYYSKSNYPANTPFIICGGGAGQIGFSNVPFWAADDCTCIICPSSICNRYVYEYLKVKQHLLKAQVRKAGVPRLSKEVIAKMMIPVPSLSEQLRIVSTLDTFEASIQNLEGQIAQRRKQYEYYRDQLLDLERKEGVEMKTIKEVFDTRNGYTPSTSNELFWNDGIIPWFKMEDIRDNGRILSDSYLHITPQAVKGKGLFKANSIILATSATIGEHALILVEFLSNQRFTNIALKEKFAKSVDMKYIYYYMFIIDEWCKQHVNQGGFASVDMTGLYNLPIPLPSLQEQQRIVSILDTFEASIQNLEAQLSQREKQYEYYRNKLLTF